MYTLPLVEAVNAGIGLIGGKAHSLANLLAAGERVPLSLCITTEAYNDFIDQCDLREKISLELSRKKFEDMRWEELWDTALRIRKVFVNTQLPEAIRISLTAGITDFFADKPVAVRSSSPEEDTAKASFAGLHESFINISGPDAVLEHIKLVWSSLWSDAALLYRQELGLSPQRSSIAVLLQEVIRSDVSGVIFSRGPDNAEQAVVEAVYGLNQGLVDGTIEPDRWLVRTADHIIVHHHAAERERKVIPQEKGTGLAPLAEDQRSLAPLTSDQVVLLARKAMQLENYFGAPQDIEWTFADTTLYLLQSRPITTSKPDVKDDQRPWYLSQRRSFENLKALHERIRDELLPTMDKQARDLASVDLKKLGDNTLANEIRSRQHIHAQWADVYWTDFIPFAHGMRLFGQVYNDRMKPDDPYQFVSLLSKGSLASISRNKLLVELGKITRENDEIKTLLSENRPSEIEHEEFLNGYQELRNMFGEMHLAFGDSKIATGTDDLVCSVILNMAGKKTGTTVNIRTGAKEELERNYLAAFPDKDEKEWAQELLELGRASYTIRDDDNIYLGRIEQQMNRALDEARSRLKGRMGSQLPLMDSEMIVASLEDPSCDPKRLQVTANPLASEHVEKTNRVQARQLLGQPAGPGVVRGRARVVTEPGHLKVFQQGEILICDSIDPNMTFIVPLAGGIVERRGGMLIHGAIIAREYGIACVTGIPDATTLIRTGDMVTVDGYLGIVTISNVKDPLA